MAGKICGHVIDQSDIAVAQATVLITHSPDTAPDIAAVTDNDGHFTFDRLSPGRYRVRAHAPTGEQSDTDAIVPTHGTTAITVRLIMPSAAHDRR